MRERKLLRLTGYDYTTPGAYFVTLCVDNRGCLLGEVIEGQMQLSRWGEVVTNCWSDLPAHYPECRLDAFVVMPNHVHGVIWILGDGLKPFSAEPEVQKTRGVPEIVRGFKTFSSRRINESYGQPMFFRWQKSYHDRIVRNDDELNRIREYIDGNPGHWHDDTEYVGIP